MDIKKPWHSKTLWAGLLVAVAPFFPPLQAVLVANPEAAGMIVGALFSGLRFVTKDQVVLKP
jgi:hypothetical protein